GDEPGNLPLLQHALYRMWRSRTGNQLSAVDYDRVGRLGGTITAHANEIISSLNARGEGQPIEKCVERWFIELTHLGEGGEDTRRRVRQEKLLATTEGLLSDSEASELLERLVGERLLTISPEMDQQGESTLRITNWIEASHEILIRRWTLLRKWIDA